MSKYSWLDERPQGVGKSFYEINGFFTSSYVFAAPYCKDKTVLDIGCGEGYGVNFLATNGAKAVVGIDYHKKTVDRCKMYYQMSNVDFLRMDATDLKFDSSTFDVIIAFEVLEHVPNHINLINEISRCLKKKGVFLFCTPNKSITSPGMKQPIMLSHVKEWYYDELFEFLSSSFSEVKILGKFLPRESCDANVTPIKLKLTRLLASSQLIRTVANFVPQRIRGILSGREEHIELSNIEIKELNRDQPDAFIGVCCK